MRRDAAPSIRMGHFSHTARRHSSRAHRAQGAIRRVRVLNTRLPALSLSLSCQKECAACYTATQTPHPLSTRS